MKQQAIRRTIRSTGGAYGQVRHFPMYNRYGKGWQYYLDPNSDTDVLWFATREAAQLFIDRLARQSTTRATRKATRARNIGGKEDPQEFARSLDRGWDEEVGQ